MASFFNVGPLGGNPFSTAVGQRIEQATDANLASENWALNMEICDMINDSSDTARDAMKAIRKRLSQNAGKNHTVIMYTLTVLETCVKNCGKAFHVLVANKEFIQELVKLIGPKNDPPTGVQEKVLSLIQVWADAFKNQPDLSGVVQVYQELKNKGIEFPVTDLDSLAPIYTPQRSVPETTSPQESRADSPESPRVFSSTPRQMAKIRADLEIVTMNMTILSEMLTELKPGEEDPKDYELLTDLVKACKEMQERIMDLIGLVRNDEVTAEMLRINDELNNLFLRHLRYEKNRDLKNFNPPSAVLGAAMGVPVANKINEPDSLIDLSDGATGSSDGISSKFSGLEIGTASSQLSKINTVSALSGATSKTSDVDEFDMLAQSRNTSVEASNSSTTNIKELPSAKTQPASLSSATQQKHPVRPAEETEFDEMAAWLDNSKDDGTEETLTSTEFDKFLAERAAAAESLPTVTTNQNGSGDDNDTSRQKKKDDKSLLIA